MKLTSKNAFRLIREFDEAARADEFKGAARPEHQDAIERDYLRKKAKLEKFVIDCMLEGSTGITIR